MTMRRWMSEMRARILGSRGGRAVLAISGSTILAQLIAVAAAPILTRLFSPEQYGSFFIVNSLGLVLAAGLALRLELAIPLPRGADDARRLVMLAAGAIVLLLVVVTSITLVGRQAISEALDLSGSAWIVLFVGPLAAAYALFAVLNAVAVRQRRYGAIARRNIVVAVLTVALQLIAGVNDLGVSGLVVSTLVAQLVGAASLYVGSSLELWRRVEPLRSLWPTLRRLSRFPLLLAPAGLLNTIGVHAPLVTVGVLYATDAAGWFGLTLRIVALPVAVIGTAIAQVFVSELSARHRERAGTERALFADTSKALSVAALGVGTLLFLFGPWAFVTAFGSAWAPAGDMARAYALATTLQILVSPISETLIVYERAVLQIVWDASRFVLTFGSLVVAWWLDASVVTAVWTLSVTTAVCYAANWEACRRTVVRSTSGRRPDRSS